MQIGEYEYDNGALLKVVVSFAEMVLGTWAYSKSESEFGKGLAATAAVHGGYNFATSLSEAISTAKRVKKSEDFTPYPYY